MGQATIAPWLAVSDAGKALRFYQTAFGAAELYRLEEEEGTVIIAEMSVQGASFWIQKDPEASPRPDTNGAVRMILVVDEPDSLFDQAVAAGATELVPVQEGHGWRIGRIADPFGHHWEIGKRLEQN
ncbi:VOC family protein [Paenibacillus silvisoli]|uniref:VOC family protein n=1 Tax=Paenibacillus silvisoli TaxID=3110539 RepID=UPI00280376AA|nr:VOC family protein [Paenibacillus silvisoli]